MPLHDVECADSVKSARDIPSNGRATHLVNNAS